MNTNPNDGAYPAPTALANSGPKERQEAFDALKEELDDALAELAALRAEVASAHAAQRHAEKELSQYMAWYAMSEHQHLHEQRRAEKAEAEAARLQAAIEQAPHDKHCVYFEISPANDCDCWKRAALAQEGEG